MNESLDSLSDKNLATLALPDAPMRLDAFTDPGEPFGEPAVRNDIVWSAMTAFDKERRKYLVVCAGTVMLTTYPGEATTYLGDGDFDKGALRILHEITTLTKADLRGQTDIEFLQLPHRQVVAARKPDISSH